jgi:DNA-binding CsgD family transcriptional regulator
MELARGIGTIEDSERRFTGRYADVLQLMAEGMKTRESARRLGVAEPTITYLRREICRRLDARNGAHAVALAIAAGYVRIDANQDART